MDNLMDRVQAAGLDYQQIFQEVLPKVDTLYT